MQDLTNNSTTHKSHPFSKLRSGDFLYNTRRCASKAIVCGLLWAIIVHLLLFNQKTFAQKKFIIGQVLNEQTKQGIKNATVINKRTRQLSRTNYLGNFLLYVIEGDSLEATHNTYGQASIRWDGKDEEPKILMQKLAIELPEVVIKTKREATLQREIDKLLREPEAKRNLSVDEALALAQSPITLLYEVFSKRAKSDRKLAVLMQQDRRKRYANLRLEAVVLRTTDFRGDKFDDFKRFCNFDDAFLLNASEYDLTHRALQRLDVYNARQSR
jgi:hypothetical protein